MDCVLHTRKAEQDFRQRRRVYRRVRLTSRSRRRLGRGWADRLFAKYGKQRAFVARVVVRRNPGTAHGTGERRSSAPMAPGAVWWKGGALYQHQRDPELQFRERKRRGATAAVGYAQGRAARRILWPVPAERALDVRARGHGLRRQL